MIPKHALQLIEAIRSSGKKLTSKDNGFVASVSIQAKQDRLLTNTQAKYLQDVYAKTSGGGDYQSRGYI